MTPRVAVIGAGMGGLTAAIRLARTGFDVTIFEAANTAGGLARAFQTHEYVYDSGPYLLLDRPGLQWIYHTLGLDIADLQLKPVDPVYEVTFPDGSSLRFHHSLQETADSFEKEWNGCGAKYTNYVEAMMLRQSRLRPHLYVSRPQLRDIVKHASWTQIPFLFRSLESVLSDFDLPPRVRDAISIWTHVAGPECFQRPFPDGICSRVVSWRRRLQSQRRHPIDSTASGPVAETAGVKIRLNQPVAKLAVTGRKVTGVVMQQQSFEPFDAVLSNAGGFNTYFRLLENPPPGLRKQLEQLPLQSPGICVYLTTKINRENVGHGSPGHEYPYLRFFLPGNDELCRLVVGPLTAESATARLIIPMRYDAAQRMSAGEMNDLAIRYFEEDWWRAGASEYRVIAVRTPREWGSDFSLYENSMNPVMTGSSFRYGRLSHKSPFFDRLYLSGSSTHPGQWVSFCGISGIIAADLLSHDLS